MCVFKVTPDHVIVCGVPAKVIGPYEDEKAALYTRVEMERSAQAPEAVRCRPRYNTAMTAGAFHEIMKRMPFEPFPVVMSSGENYNVVHLQRRAPQGAFVTAKALILAIPDPSDADGERLAFC